MKRLLTLIGCFSVLSAAPFAFAQIVMVKSPLADDAVFSQGSLTAEGSDGARVVIGQAVMITATSGSKILGARKSESEPLQIELGPGAFRLHVGSKPVAVKAGEKSLEAAGAVLLATEGEGALLVRVIKLFEGGRVGVGRISQQGSQAEVLESGKDYKIASNDNSSPASADDKKKLDALAARLVETGKAPVLEPAAVEDPADLAGAASGAGEAMELAEIEAVEVEIEADCVEICTD